MEEFNEFENLTNSTFEHDLQPDTSTYNITMDVVLAILCIVGIGICSITIYTLLQYKKLNTVPNMFIANWSIADIFLIITLHSNNRLIEAIYFTDIPSDLLNLLFSLEFTFRNIYMFFVLAVTIDWLLASYFSKASHTFRNCYKFVIGVVWVLHFMLCFASVALQFFFPALIYVFGYLIFILFFLVIYIIIGVQKCRKRPSNHPTLMLTLATILMTCWIPIWLNLPLSDVFDRYLRPLLECCYLASPCITFLALYRSDKDFQACFQQATKCSQNRYVEEISEFESFPETSNNEDRSAQPNVCQIGHRGR